MQNLLDDASLPTDIPGLTAELAELEKRLSACQEDIQKLMAAEDPAKGVFYSAEIHDAKKTLMMLRYQKDLRTVRLNHLRVAG